MQLDEGPNNDAIVFDQQIGRMILLLRFHENNLRLAGKRAI